MDVSEGCQREFQVLSLNIEKMGDPVATATAASHSLAAARIQQRGIN